MTHYFLVVIEDDEDWDAVRDHVLETLQEVWEDKAGVEPEQPTIP